MQLIHTAADVAKLADPALRNLIEATIAALSEDEPFDAAVLGYFLIVEPGDIMAELDAQIGFSILANRWTGLRFDAQGYKQHFGQVKKRTPTLITINWFKFDSASRKWQ